MFSKLLCNTDTHIVAEYNRTTIIQTIKEIAKFEHQAHFLIVVSFATGCVILDIWNVFGFFLKAVPNSNSPRKYNIQSKKNRLKKHFCQLPNVLALQDAVAAHMSSSRAENRPSGLNVKSLINLCYISVHFGSFSPNLVAVLQDLLMAYPNDENEFLFYKEIRKLVQLVQNNIFPSHQKSEILNLCRAFMLNTTR